LLSVKDATWKVADFGFASEGLSREAYTSVLGRGTDGYRAPELVSIDALEIGKAGKPSDIWALGCIFFELVTRRRAFFDSYKLVQFKKGEYNPIKPPLFTRAPKLRDYRVGVYVYLLLKRIFQLNLGDRPTAKEVLLFLSAKSDDVTPVYVFTHITFEEGGKWILRHDGKVGLYLDDDRWKHVAWSVRWYSTHVGTANVIASIVVIGRGRSKIGLAHVNHRLPLETGNQSLSLTVPILFRRILLSW
jgi:serine/threonine protein kinase